MSGLDDSRLGVLQEPPNGVAVGLVVDLLGQLEDLGGAGGHSDLAAVGHLPGRALWHWSLRGRHGQAASRRLLGLVLGGQLFSTMVVCKPAHLFLDELDVVYDEQEDYIVIKHTALFTSTIMSKILVRPNVKLFNAVVAKDLIMKEGRVVTNLALVSMNHDTQSCMDPNVMEAKVVVSSCGHDGPLSATGVKRLKSIGMIDSVPGMKALDTKSIGMVVVRLTREIVLGMIVTGMEVAKIGGSPRMGPYLSMMLKLTFKLMERVELKALGRSNAIDGTCGVGTEEPHLIFASTVEFRDGLESMMLDQWMYPPLELIHKRCTPSCSQYNNPSRCTLYLYHKGCTLQCISQAISPLKSFVKREKGRNKRILRRLLLKWTILVGPPKHSTCSVALAPTWVNCELAL
ncbi:Thiamine thiazole synthase 2, chloroplastic [Glycine soja]